MTHAARQHPDSIPAPLAFAIGYAGPRWLGADAQRNSHDGQLRAALDTMAMGLRARLAAHRPLCLVGSLAQGADLAIAEAMIGHGAVLCAWLPEPLDRFANDADFPDSRDRERIAVLVRGSELVEVRVASSSAERRERFAECAAHIVRETEAMLCVRHWEAEAGRGGTEETVAFARALGRPLVEVRLRADPAAPAEVVFPPAWTARADAGALPFPRPSPRAIVAGWKAAASAAAGRSKQLVVGAAAWTVGLQLGVTLLAVVGVQHPEWELVSLLAKTVVILAVAGIAVWSSRRGAATRWAERRFAAELQRSWAAVRGLRGSANWFEDDLPTEFARHGRDLALLHGLDRSADGDLVAFRARYGSERLGGQLAYAQRAADGARRGRGVLKGIFHGCLLATIAALLTRLVLQLAALTEAAPGLDAGSALVAILGPACGAAAVSFVALLDLSARSELQSGLGDFLREQQRLLAACNDWASVRHVVVATERRLLGEIKGWYARHAFRR